MKKMYIPYMCDGALPLAAAFRRFGIEAEVLPPSTRQSFEKGVSACRGAECSPCFAVIGSVLELVERAELPHNQCRIFLPEGPGPCRFGQYAQLLRLALSEAGAHEVEIVSPTSGDAYAGVGRRLLLQVWRGIVLADLLYKSLLATRPYEREGGSAEQVYRDSLGKLVEIIEHGRKKEMGALPHELAAAFLRIPLDRARPRPRVAVVGEIYARLNPFSNNNLVSLLEEEGAEVSVEPFAPWMLYTNWLKKGDLWKERRILPYLSALIQDIVQKWVEHHHARIFLPVIREHETPIERIMAYSRDYFPFCLRGEAGIAIGSIIDRIKKGCHGIVNILPLNCMPGNNVKGQIPRITERFPGIPIMSLEIKDGSQETYIRTRLGPFVESARSAMRASAG